MGTDTSGGKVLTPVPVSYTRVDQRVHASAAEDGKHLGILERVHGRGRLDDLLTVLHASRSVLPEAFATTSARTARTRLVHT